LSTFGLAFDGVDFLARSRQRGKKSVEDFLRFIHVKRASIVPASNLGGRDAENGALDDTELGFRKAGK
jgi:hypothetical protein